MCTINHDGCNRCGLQSFEVAAIKHHLPDLSDDDLCNVAVCADWPNAFTEWQWSSPTVSADEMYKEAGAAKAAEALTDMFRNDYREYYGCDL